MKTQYRSSGFAITLFSIALGFVASCATDESDSTDDSTSTTQQDLSSNEKAAFKYFVARGLTKRQSAGIVGNLIQESSVNPKAVEFGGGPGRGIAQWSVRGRWDTSHHDNVTWYANAHNASRWTLNTQLAFTWYELHTVGGYGLTALRKDTTIRSATITFERDFEKCGQCDESKRVEYAREVYNAFANSARVVGVDDEAMDDDVESAVATPDDEGLEADTVDTGGE
jgi:hypothetical protein